ncbi:MAG: hypothetical protein KBD01_00965 [Acidobacteria bacterium]|nr:hypothetical protein [Acidobacteriota bacterium]
MKTDNPQPAKTWEKPAIEWEERYEPVVFAASCTSQPFNCGAGARG